MLATLQRLGVVPSFSRPGVSNDNPFSESEFRTMKYRPNYPGSFPDLQAARTHIDRYVAWYNQHHRHSALALFTPDQVHDGTWLPLWRQRDHTHQAYYQAHPERFRRRPTPPSPAPIVGINLPKQPAP